MLLQPRRAKARLRLCAANLASQEKIHIFTQNQKYLALRHDWRHTIPMEMMEIGYISRPHGIKGEVFLRLYSEEVNWSSAPESFKLKMKTGSQLSAKSEQMRSHKNGIIIKFDQIADRNEAENFISTKVFADKKFYTSEEGENPYFHELIGLKLFDIDEQLLGKIDGMLSTGHQDIMSIKTPEGETFLAPYVDAFIVEDKRQEGELIVNFPEGLQNLP